MNSRDLELLSAYLDGQLSPSDSAQLETRLKTDGELVSALDDLRVARTLLHKLPKRRAPRNFTLTRKMVGLNPPLPRAYPAFRFATVAATLLFFFTFGLNALVPRFLSFGMGAAATQPVELFSAQEPALAAAPAATAAPAEPALGLAPLSTELPPAEDAARVAETPMVKIASAENAGEENQAQPAAEAAHSAPFTLSIWQMIFAIIAILGAVFMALLRRNAANRWK